MLSCNVPKPELLCIVVIQATIHSQESAPVPHIIKGSMQQLPYECILGKCLCGLKSQERPWALT